MALYRYVKNWPSSYEPPKIEAIAPAVTVAVPVLYRVLPTIFILVGLILISVVIYPFFSYKLNVNRWRTDSLITPVPEVSIAEAKGLVNPLPVKSEEVVPRIKVIDTVDYSLVSNWFPGTPVPPVNPSKVTHYSLSIPKLKIDKAAVTIGGKRLFDTLIQYPGTALPGEYGNTVIFGHSVLPTFYNPKDYKAIFSLIPTMEKGDKILVDYDGMQFAYQVENYYEVKPEEIDILEQRFDQQLLRLVTCVPPGTYIRRGILQARLIKI